MAVPDSYREGSFGLGAGRLRTVFRIIQKMLEAFVLRVRKNITLVVAVKLLPKGCSIGF